MAAILFHSFTIDDAIFPASCYRQARGFSQPSSNTWLSSAAWITARSPTMSGTYI
jgi:hypothetical protein